MEAWVQPDKTGDGLVVPGEITHRARLGRLAVEETATKLEGGGVGVVGDWVQARAGLINQS